MACAQGTRRVPLLASLEAWNETHLRHFNYSPLRPLGAALTGRGPVSVVGGQKSVVGNRWRVVVSRLSVVASSRTTY